MTISEAISKGKQNISSSHAKLLLAEMLGYNPLEILNYLDKELSQEDVDKYFEVVQAVKEGTPIQYALGNVNFYGEKFFINNNVLIPRFETEELIENTLKYIYQYFNEDVAIIDLGCGSGCIGLTIKKHLAKARVDLIDISEDAISVAKENAKRLNADVTIYQSDMLDNVNGKYDIIISNPPYIKNDEEIEDVVKDNEPHLALYAGSDGLDCYKKILKNVVKHMNYHSLICFEIGMTQKESIKKLIKEYLPNSVIEVKKDLSGKDRMVFIFNNISYLDKN